MTQISRFTEIEMRHKVKRIYRRWLEDEKFFGTIMATSQPEEYSDATEVMRNLGSAIAYAQSMVNSTDPLSVNDRPASHSDTNGGRNG